MVYLRTDQDRRLVKNTPLHKRRKQLSLERLHACYNSSAELNNRLFLGQIGAMVNLTRARHSNPCAGKSLRNHRQSTSCATADTPPALRKSFFYRFISTTSIARTKHNPTFSTQLTSFLSSILLQPKSYCDGLHMDLPLKYFKQIEKCSKQPHDPEVTKLCEECGWAGPRDKWPELPETDSEGSDCATSEDEEEETEEARKKEEKAAKTLAANTPKVQIELQSDQGVSSTSSTSTAEAAAGGEDVTVQVQRGCSGSCKTRHHQEIDTNDVGVTKVTEGLNKTSL